jgi:hypothetical protein
MDREDLVWTGTNAGHGEQGVSQVPGNLLSPDGALDIEVDGRGSS